ncbi:hypothetical protein BTI74_08630 [Lactobacillus delbrueckii subsp. bulgaricus]|nr:hypothetical protein [Lactobacillus delbrueckii subsp. bulgaricus]
MVLLSDLSQKKNRLYMALNVLLLFYRMPLMYGLLVILIANLGQGGITSIIGMLIFIYMVILY